MIFMTMYRWSPENRNAVIERFQKTGGLPPPGIKLLSRWTDVAGGRGFTLTESNDPIAMSKFSHDWSDLMSFEMIPVLDDEQLGKVLAG